MWATIMEPNTLVAFLLCLVGVFLLFQSLLEHCFGKEVEVRFFDVKNVTTEACVLVCLTNAFSVAYFGPALAC
jgi:hypothetical protein